MKIINIEEEIDYDEVKIFFNKKDKCDEFIFYDRRSIYFSIGEENTDNMIDIKVESIDNLIKALNILKEEIEKNGLGI